MKSFNFFFQHLLTKADNNLKIRNNDLIVNGYYQIHIMR